MQYLEYYLQNNTHKLIKNNTDNLQKVIDYLS